MKLLREYRMKSDGIQAPGAIVLRYNPENSLHPYVVHFRNDQCGGHSYGDYCRTIQEAQEAYERKCKRYDPTGQLFIGENIHREPSLRLVPIHEVKDGQA